MNENEKQQGELPKWIDDQKGKDPLMDDMIQYIEQLHAAIATSQQGEEPVAVYSEDEKERAEKLLSQIAKAYSDRIAEACDVDKGDHWQFHGDVVLEDVRFIMRTAHEILPASEPEADQAIQQPQDDLLREAAEHLRLHAEEYSHPGQHGLIARIEAALAKKGGAQ